MFATNEQNRSKHILLKVILGMDLRVNPVQFPQNSMKYLFQRRYDTYDETLNKNVARLVFCALLYPDI